MTRHTPTSAAGSSEGGGEEVFMTRWRTADQKHSLMERKKNIDQTRQKAINTKVVSFLDEYPLPKYIPAKQE